MYKTYTKYIKIYESTTPQPHIIRLLAVPGQYRKIKLNALGDPGDPEGILVLSRVGDRPTATILHAQFHFFDFCFCF